MPVLLERMMFLAAVNRMLHGHCGKQCKHPTSTVITCHGLDYIDWLSLWVTGDCYKLAQAYGRGKRWLKTQDITMDLTL